MGACGWEVLGCDSCTAYASLDEEVQAVVENWAVQRLWEWTNQRFGLCEEVVRPSRVLGTDCRSYEVRLPGPIAEVVEVLIDGEEIDLSSFRVDNYNLLVRQDGGVFPRCQDFSKPATEEGTWQVTYLLGEEVPDGGEMVAGILACEYAKSLCGASDCRLPKRVSSVQRQGVVIGILDNFTNLENGFTGIFEIDDWIMSATKPKRRSVASSPDVTPPRITTWTYDDS